jgi:DNA invertase Pin-like site-specific DNA recombinase
MKHKLTAKAKQWLTLQPSDTADRLIELAASDRPISLAIARALDLDHPDRTLNKSGPKSSASDDVLLELRSQGLSYRAIGAAVGLSGATVGKRLKKLKGEQK